MFLQYGIRPASELLPRVRQSFFSLFEAFLNAPFLTEWESPYLTRNAMTTRRQPCPEPSTLKAMPSIPHRRT